MKGKVFVDTNVLVYLFSSDEPAKRDSCSKIINDLNLQSKLVWSTQVMQEFCNTLIKKFKIDPLQVKANLRLFENFEIVVNDKNLVEKAIDIHGIYHFSFWDSLVIGAALASQCEYLLTEDLQLNQSIQGLKVISPFHSN